MIIQAETPKFILSQYSCILKLLLVLQHELRGLLHQVTDVNHVTPPGADAQNLPKLDMLTLLTLSPVQPAKDHEQVLKVMSAT